MVFDALRRSLRNTFRWKGRASDEIDGKNLLKCKVALLDGTDVSVNLQKQALGKDLMVRVLRHLDLVEKDFFGLQFMDTNNVPHWIDPTKKVRKQVQVGPPFTLHFRVKFYAVDPHKLKEELTRYHFFLQVKQDIRDGKLHPTAKQAIELGAYAVQSELGDFDNTIHSGNYVSEFRLVKDQNMDIERAVEKKHRALAGMNPAECEVRYLTIAQNLEYYGMDRHEVMNEENQPCVVGLTPRGIIVMKNGNKLGDHSWRSITNITFKQSRFIMCAKTNENEQQEYRFQLTSARASKHLWKCAIEYHSFFRLVAATEDPDRNRPQGLLSFGSRFRYSGRTLHQTAKDDTQGRKSMMFKRTRSERFAQRSTIGYIRIGSKVWAKDVSGDYYLGVVTAMAENVHVKFDKGETISWEKNEEPNIVYDMPPNANELKIGTKVIAHWSGVAAYLVGTIAKIEGAKYHVYYNDGDKGTNRLEQMRILKPPLYFGPGSGRSNLQKKYSMKTTILAGESGTNTVGDGPSRVQVDVNNSSRSGQKSQSHRSQEPSSSQGSNGHRSASSDRSSEKQHRGESSRSADGSRSSSAKHVERSHSSERNHHSNAAKDEKSHSSRSSSSKSSSRSSSKSNKVPAAESVPLMEKGSQKSAPPARTATNLDTGKSYQITDL